VHKTAVVKRSEPCYYFALSKFRNQLLAFYAEHPEFIQPESRRNEVVTLVQAELKDVNITRTGETWGIRVPFDPEFTIYVWFDALLNYISPIADGGYVVEQRIKPHINGKLRIERHLDAPVLAGAGDIDILDLRLHQRHDYVAARF